MLIRTDLFSARTGARRARSAFAFVVALGLTLLLTAENAEAARRSNARRQDPAAATHAVGSLVTWQGKTWEVTAINGNNRTLVPRGGTGGPVTVSQTALSTGPARQMVQVDGQHYDFDNGKYLDQTGTWTPVPSGVGVTRNPEPYDSTKVFRPQTQPSSEITGLQVTTPFGTREGRYQNGRLETKVPGTSSWVAAPEGSTVSNQPAAQPPPTQQSSAPGTPGTTNLSSSGSGPANSGSLDASAPPASAPGSTPAPTTNAAATSDSSTHATPSGNPYLGKDGKTLGAEYRAAEADLRAKQEAERSAAGKASQLEQDFAKADLEAAATPQGSLARQSAYGPDATKNGVGGLEQKASDARTAANNATTARQGAQTRVDQIREAANKNADSNEYTTAADRESDGPAISDAEADLQDAERERGQQRAERDIEKDSRLKATRGKGACAHASQIGDGGTDCGITKGMVAAGQIVNMGSQAAGQLTTQIQNQRIMDDTMKDGASQARQARAAGKMAQTAADAQWSVAALNGLMGAWTGLRAMWHNSDSEKIDAETKDPEFFRGETGRIGVGESETADLIAEGPVDRKMWNRKMKNNTTDNVRNQAYNQEVYDQFRGTVKNYGQAAASEHSAMSEKATESSLSSLGTAMTAAIGAYGNQAAAKQYREAARAFEKSGDFTVPDFKSDPFPQEGDQGRTDVVPVPQPSAETAQADVLPENDVPNLGDGFRLDPDEKLTGVPLAPGAFKPDEGRGPAGGGAGGGLSGSGTSAASAEDKQTPQAQYAGLGKGSGTFEREGGRGGNNARGGGAGRGEGGGSLTDMMGFFKNMFGKEEDSAAKKSDFMALGRATAASGNDGLLGRGVNIFDRISLTYTSRAKTGSFGGN